MTVRCPGQDQRFWKPDDICYVDCPHCGGEIEFWKDEPVRACPDCAAEVHHPRLEVGCAAWCQYTEECLGSPGPAAPDVQRSGDHAATAQQEAIRRARELLAGCDLAVAGAQGGLVHRSGLIEAAVLGTPHRIDDTLVVLRFDGQPTHPVDELLLLRYLAAASERAIRPLGEQIAFRDLPGGTFYQGALARRTENLLIDTFQSDIDLFRRVLDDNYPVAAYPLADASAPAVARQVHAIGAIDLLLVYRAGDEELPPGVSIVYDRIIGRVFRTDEVAALATRLCLGLRAVADLGRH